MAVWPTTHQTTVDHVAHRRGVGLHTGAHVTFRLEPAAAGTGIVFIRADLDGAPTIAATPDAIDRAALDRRTGLMGADGASVATVEHLLAACLGMGLDNVRVRLDGPELPIFDGSALPFTEVIREARLVTLAEPRRTWRLARPVSLIDGDREIHAIPARTMQMAFFAELLHGGLPNQAAEWALDPASPQPEDFAAAIAPARTFVFFEDVERLKAAGLIRGGNLSCALVLKDGAPLKGQGDYRLPNELACHKLLDLMGDLAILGRPLEALITARGTGHAMHQAFVQQLRKELIDHGLGTPDHAS